jgi:hypothetical protein
LDAVRNEELTLIKEAYHGVLGLALATLGFSLKWHFWYIIAAAGLDSFTEEQYTC